MKKGRIVVRVEIGTLCGDNGKFSHAKMDRFAMILSNLHNSGKEILVVSSGAIALGSEKLKVKINMTDVTGMMAVAAVGQAELIKYYQRYFDQYNQKIAQVLLTTDIINDETRNFNTQNTFETLLDMKIIPIINENDAVSTSDIELEDNYILALNVANMSDADIILVKMDPNGKHIIQPRGGQKAILVENEEDLMKRIEEICGDLMQSENTQKDFPNSISEMVF